MKRKVLQELALKSPSLNDFKDFSETLSAKAKGNQLFLLSGDLGSGKTQFSRFFISALGGSSVMSPSFAIENQYQLKSFTLHHFDLYRLESSDEIESSGLWDAFLPGDIVLVEWAERVSFQDWPVDWQVFHLQLSSDHSVLFKHYAALA